MRPCPFCKNRKISGAGARLPDGVEIGGQSFVYFGQCDVCFARGPVMPDMESARQAWNKGVYKE